MEAPALRREDYERAFEYFLKARREPSLESWTELADFSYNQLFQFDPPGGEDFGRNVLHALVEVSWDAWNVDQDKCKEGIRVGLQGATNKGTPPFLNRGLGMAHAVLSIALEEDVKVRHTPDSLALGRLLLSYHILEAFVRPGMVMAAYLIRTIAGEEPTIEKILKDKKEEIASFNTTRDGFKGAINALKGIEGDWPYLYILEEFWKSTQDEQNTQGASVDLGQIRNAIAHHDFDIYQGVVRLRWVHYAKKGMPGKIDAIWPPWMEANLKMLRGLVSTFFAWESMMVAVFENRLIPEDVGAAEIAQVAVDWIEQIRRGERPPPL